MDHDYTKNHYRLIAVDLSRQKFADPTAIQEKFEFNNSIEFVKQFKNTDGKIADCTKSMFNKFRKIKEKRLKFHQENMTVL